ncbi:MAG TPA: methyltransferase, partial [Rhodobiaceae bacterium]|nr:methyltransferase [Rhodobiaceae bacterium]
DYLFGPDPDGVDWTILNSSFRLAEQFISRALRTSRVGVAAIVRSAFLEGIGRYQNLFSEQPASLILQFTERVVMHKGRLSKDGSTATAYCWLVWQQGRDGLPQFDWIPPCRRRLERLEDYE